MCLAIPARILSLDGYQATVDIAGVTRAASIRLTPDAKVGDYVLLHTGYAIQIMSQEEAAETLAILREAAQLIVEEDQ
jgi:hydrogenase expression/formation protein HypC